MNYRLAYAIGFHPWEDLADHPPFAEKLLELVAREENGAGPPYGPALDIGTGSGIWGAELGEARLGGHRRGHRARRRSARARNREWKPGVDMRLVHGDVTALRQSEVGSRLPHGARHWDVPRPERGAAGRDGRGGDRDRRADDATVILDCFAPRRRGPLPRGASRRRRRARVPRLGDHRRRGRGLRTGRAGARMLKFEERFYRLRRR